MTNKSRRSFTKKGMAIAFSLAALAFALPASAEDGITNTTVKIGASYPLTGVTAVTGIMGRGVDSFIRYTTEALGGVTMADGKKRKIEFIMLDDAFEMPRVLANTQRLVERDRVFAMAGFWGTQPNLSARPYLNEQKVPHLFAGTQATTISVDADKFPWTAPGFMMTFSTEAAIYAEFLKKQKPNGTIAILNLNTDGGREFLNAFEEAIKGTNLKVVAKANYELTAASVDAEVINLARSNADIFFNISTGKQAAQSIRKAGEIGWKPLHVIIGQSSSIDAVLKPAGVENAKGIYTVAFLKDPGDQRWKSDPEMIKYKDLVTKYGNGANPEDQFILFGVAMGDAIVQSLAASQPTRKSLIDATRNLKAIRPLGLLPGITMSTGPNDKFLLESGYLQQFDGERWQLVGEMISKESK